MTYTEQVDIEEITSELAGTDVDGKSFLITGSTGSLARYCALAILEMFRSDPSIAGKVILLCRDGEKAKRIFSDYLGCGFMEILTDPLDRPLRYTGKIDYILHAACVSASSYIRKNPVETIVPNAVGTYQLLRLAKEKSVSGFLFFSSGAVYGGNTKDDASYNGMDPLIPQNCYGLSKQMGENLCTAFWEEHGVPAKVVRIGYTYGPHANLNDGHLYSDFIRAIVNREDLMIRGNGNHPIGLCYVSDAVRAFFLILFHGAPAMPYVMRNHMDFMPIEKIAEILTQSAFADRGLGYHCSKRNGDALSVARVPELLHRLGWRPKVGLEEGFRRAVEHVEELHTSSEFRNNNMEQ